MTATLTPPGAGEAAEVEGVLAQIQSLPTLPAVALRLIERTSDPGSHAREIVRLVESDPSIAARILSLVRKAHVGSNVTTIDRAVILLGFDAVRALALSMHVVETFAELAPQEGRLDAVGFWRHSLAVGCASRRLAQETAGAANPEEAFLCGLLHDIGKLTLHVCFPKSYERVILSVESNRGTIAEVERQVFGLDHTLAGRRLAVHWQLPAMIEESIWLHHHRPRSTPVRIGFAHHVHLVQLADRLVRELHIGYSGNHSIESAADLGEEIGVSTSLLAGVQSALPGDIEERAELIGLDRVTSREVYQTAVSQANSELGRISSRLALQQQKEAELTRCVEALDALMTGLDEEPAHEQVLTAAADGLARMYRDRQVAVWCGSRRRGLSLLCARRSGETVTDIRPLSAESAGVPQAEGWLAASVLLPGLRDQISRLMPQSLWWCWPVRCVAECEAALVVSAELESEPEAHGGIDLLARATARWLGVAEALVRSRQLHEELATINAQLTGAQSEMARMRSLAMVGEMAAGAAHELNNPLAVISGRAQLLNREGLSDEVRKAAGIISEHAARASGLVSDLMEFAKPPAPQPRELDLAALLGELRESWVRSGALAVDQIELRVSDDLPRIRADEAQMRVLFDELIRNAIEAVDGVESPLVVINCARYPADDRVVVTVNDNGRGMSPEVLDRAGTPFYSARAAGRGRGLGLSRAMRYAEINGGRIRLFSRAEAGTEAIVELSVTMSR